MNHKVFLNGRFLTRPLAGVQRTAYELVRSIDSLLDQPRYSDLNIKFILIYSGAIVNHINLKNIKIQRKGLMAGNLWEQLELPVYTAGHLLVSMCSISSIFKKKQILIVHDASFLVNKRFFSTRFRIWYKLAIPWIAKISRQIITVSQFSKSELVTYGKLDPDKITVIYNAANHMKRFGSPSQEFMTKINFLKPYCLSVSSLGVNKNFDGLSKAIRQIDFSKYKMLIAGSAVSALAPSSVQTGVNYLGYVSNNELKYLYQNATLFIFPSFYEGFGIPPLEAMSLGCPVIASNTSSIPEVLGNACAYFDPSRPEDMAKKINDLLYDTDELKNLSDKGYQKAAEYSWDRSGIATYDLIKKYYD